MSTCCQVLYCHWGVDDEAGYMLMASNIPGELALHVVQAATRGCAGC